MIRFAVLDDSGPAQALALEHASIIGKEDLTIPGTLTFDAGLLTCKRHSTDAAGVSLMIEAGPAGRLALQTCLLPDRAEPYLLSLELARHRIMLVLNKLEAWGLSDLPGDHPIMAGLDRARELFTRALIAPRDPAVGWTVEHSKLARQALVVGIDVSERLAVLAAERELQARWTSGDEGPMPGAGATPASGSGGASHDSSEDTASDIPALGKVQLGCSVHAGQFAEPLQKIIARDFDFISCPIRWSEIEKDEGRRCDLEAGMAKLLGARVAWANADNALQIHGGNGFALEYQISRILCDARILNIFEGAAEIQAQRLRWQHVIGPLTIDVAYGGNYYAIVELQGAYKGVDALGATRILELSPIVRSLVREKIEPIHPLNPTIKGVSHVLWADAPKSDGAHGRNAVFYGDRAIDRSPCGTGTSARLAHLHALEHMRGEAPAGHQPHVQLDALIIVRRVGERERAPLTSATHF